MDPPGVVHQVTSTRAASSIPALRSLTNLYASPPSTARWSKVRLNA
jgi:hypothetical protein